MSLLFAFLLAASPTAATAEAPVKKPKLRCEWIHEVGTSRPRRVCVKREQPKAAEAARAEPARESADEKEGDRQPATDN
jgi:hypothetical protein